MNKRALIGTRDYADFGRVQEDIEDTFCVYPFLGKEIDFDYTDTYRPFRIREIKKSYRERDELRAVYRIVEKPIARSGDSIVRSQDSERAWAAVGYAVILGLVIALAGSIVRFLVPDWWPLAVAAGGMLLVVIALWQGRHLAQQ
jgi:hypothetical protein